MESQFIITTTEVNGVAISRILLNQFDIFCGMERNDNDQWRVTCRDTNGYDLENIQFFAKGIDACIKDNQEGMKKMMAKMTK